MTTTSRLSVFVCIAALASAIAMHGAQAQPTGNPKGSAPPPIEGNAAKKPANPARPVDTGRSDPLDESKGPTQARTKRTERPGGGSSTGGLTRRSPQETQTSPAPEPSNANSRPGKK